MLAPTYRETLEKYYLRTFRDPLPTRLASMGVIAGLTGFLEVWPWTFAAVWAAAYLAVELAMVAWWARVQPLLRSTNAAGVRRLQDQLIAICAVACALTAAPCFFTAFGGHDRAILGVILTSGILLVAAASHSLSRNMILLTTPAAVIALELNLLSLGHGIYAWVFALLGLAYVANARMLQLSNATVFHDLVALRMGAEAANTAKSEFLATMSHEIRTPLNGVLGMVQAMERDSLTDPQRERLQLIGQSGKSLLAVLGDILDLSKIEAGKLELETADFSLGALADGVYATFAPVAEEQGVAFRLDVDAAALGVYRGDPVRVRQILCNLVSNALKFTAVGRVDVRIDQAANGVRMAVSDTGIGMSPDQIVRLFDKFVQGDASITRRFGGAGLGLAICRELCRAMGGEIAVQSAAGQGSRFVVELPLPRMAEAAPASAPVATVEAMEARGLRVLAAEDNPMNQLVLKTLLGQAGLELELVADGAEALAAWEREVWDLILMDVQMPVMDGLTATRNIRRREAETGRPATPIVAVTANAMTHQVETYRVAGMTSFVAKPIEAGRLFEAIESALAGENASIAA